MLENLDQNFLNHYEYQASPAVQAEAKLNFFPIAISGGSSSPRKTSPPHEQLLQIAIRKTEPPDSNYFQTAPSRPPPSHHLEATATAKVTSAYRSVYLPMRARSLQSRPLTGSPPSTSSLTSSRRPTKSRTTHPHNGLPQTP